MDIKEVLEKIDAAIVHLLEKEMNILVRGLNELNLNHYLLNMMWIRNTMVINSSKTIEKLLT